MRGIKLKTSNFQILTRQRRLSEPSDVTQMFYSVAVDLLNDFDHPGPFRLIGVVGSVSMIGSSSIFSTP